MKSIYPAWFKNNSIKLIVATNYECNVVGFKHETLPTIQCGDTTCDNWFHHLYQNKYNISEYSNKFDKIHGVKKCCK